MAVLLAFAFASCSTVKGLFGGGSDEHTTGGSKHGEEDLSEVLKLEESGDYAEAFRRLIYSGLFYGSYWDISSLKENKMEPVDYDDPQFTALLNETYLRIGGKYFDSVVADVKPEIVKRLQKDFLAFMLFWMQKARLMT